jgi:hypothetical protein
MTADCQDVPEFDWELTTIRYQRYKEAKEAGLTMAERKLFAESDMDIGILRACVQGGCPVELIRQIVL